MMVVRLVLLVVLGSTVLATPAQAYIGPGSGIAIGGAAFTLLTTFVLAIGALVSWPFRYVWRRVRIGNPYAEARWKRVVVLGLDGLDPGLLSRYLAEGRLPHFARLVERGVFRPLATTHPSMSPVAWSTFSTGVDPSRHSIYDFLTRDPCTYGPLLSSTEVRAAKRVLPIGRYLVPLEKPKLRLLQKSQPFWKLLGERSIFSIIQRVPITFPPVPFRGLLLSGMCVPDLHGTQGTFSFFSTATRPDGAAAFTGGEQTVLRRKGDVIRSRILGPENTLIRASGKHGHPHLTLPFTLTLAADRSRATLEIEGHDPVELLPRRYTDWVRLTFRAGLGTSVHGIVRFYLSTLEPDVSLYMTPIHLDPEHPAMPISHPGIYSVYLAKKLGPFATLGLAEDTWALNERVIDEDAFLDQALLICAERERMFEDALRTTRRGLVTCVFDTTDRVQHMFYRYLDPTHPANEGKDLERHRDAILHVYERMDALLGRIGPEIERDDTLFVLLSDHGFTNFRRGVNVNAWLRDEGYLVLREGATTSGDWFEAVDWTRTRAFALGLTGLFVNRRGRERDGTVGEGAEYDALVAELAAKLRALVDPQTGRRCILEAHPASQLFDGPYALDAPDLVIGYDGGYRHSWECATGAVTRDVFTDNTKSWSGDHCVDPRIVPGVLLSNQPIAVEDPSLADLAPSVLDAFGQRRPGYMKGRPLFAGPERTAEVRGGFDPARLDQSGVAPLARAVPDARADRPDRTGERDVLAGTPIGAVA